MTNYLYRLEGYASRKVPLYINNQFCAPRGGVFVCKFEVIKKTLHGSWIYDGIRKRFVNHDWDRQYAYRTEHEAIKSFRIRKDRQREHLREMLRQVNYT